MQKQKNDRRFHTIDALRGIAALIVAFYHVSLVSLAVSEGGFNAALAGLLHYGYLGVSIFFVISGFVIAASMSGARVTYGYFGKFILKRSIRLDPTYWASIALDIALAYIALKLLFTSTDLPSVSKVLWHLIYAQDLAGVGNIAAVYWTLCIEVQFYIVFCLTLAIDSHVSKKGLNAPGWRSFKALIFTAITIYSAFVFVRLVEVPINGLFVSYWLLFVLGASAYHWGIQRKDDNTTFPMIIALSAILLGYQIMRDGWVVSLTLAVAWLTAILLYIGARREQLSTWLNNKTLLYLGARSYSIYLFHTIIGERAAELLTQVIYPKLGFSATDSMAALVAFAVGVGASLVAAEIAYRFVELPSLALSKRIKPAQRGSLLSELSPSSIQTTAR